MVRPLQGGACPQLTKLDLSGGGISPAIGRARGEAMRDREPQEELGRRLDFGVVGQFKLGLG